MIKNKLLDLFEQLYKDAKRNIETLAICRGLLVQLAIDWDKAIAEYNISSESRDQLNVILEALDQKMLKTDELIYKVEHPEDDLTT